MWRLYWCTSMWHGISLVWCKSMWYLCMHTRVWAYVSMWVRDLVGILSFERVLCQHVMVSWNIFPYVCLINWCTFRKFFYILALCVCVCISVSPCIWLAEATYICMYIFMYVCMCSCMYVYIMYLCVCACVCVSAPVCVFASLYMPIQTLLWCPSCVHMCIYACVQCAGEKSVEYNSRFICT